MHGAMNFDVMIWRTGMQWLMDDNVEWIGMEDVAEPSKLLNPPNSCVRLASSGSKFGR